MKAMEMIKEQTEQLARKAGLPPVRHVTVYEEVKAAHGILIHVPVRKIKSYQAMGLVCDERIDKVVVR